ncbi:DoxX family protein [Haloplanus sp. GCM10025708]|uniref:DoxX family protein n=1 Tax=Haloferacaceae TaxID=1644056 RepID=UPI0036208338
MAITGTAAVALLVARVCFGGVLVFTGLNHFTDPSSLAAYAESKGVPAPKFAVYASGVLLVAGGLAIVAGVYAGVGALLSAAFFLVATPTMHDFWAVPEDQRQDEMNQFLKNAALFGGSLVFFAVSYQSWGYAAGIGLV